MLTELVCRFTWNGSTYDFSARSGKCHRLVSGSSRCPACEEAGSVLGPFLARWKETKAAVASGMEARGASTASAWGLMELQLQTNSAVSKDEVVIPPLRASVCSFARTSACD